MPRHFMAVTAILLTLAACSAPGSATTTPVSPEASPITLPTTSTVMSPASTAEAVEPLFPVVVGADNGEVVIEQRPERVVSLSPSATEMLFAIGAGGQVVSVDSYSNYPPEAPTSDLSGFTPNIEAIAAFEPDLVIVSFDSDGLVDALSGLGIPVIMQGAATTIDDAYSQIEVLGIATGNLAEAALLVADMQRQIDAIVEGVSLPDFPLIYFHELGSELYSATSATFIGEIYGLFGLVNIADSQDPDGWGYPQVTAEHILDQDPHFIFLADTKCCGQSTSTVAERPGWDVLQAVANGGVIELDDDVASRWGPRIVDYVQAVADAIGIYQTVNA